MAKKNFKQLALDHVEKVVFGVLALVALLALVGANWQPYSGTPNEITDKIAQGKKVWQANTWPEDEKQLFAISQEAAPANLVYERLSKAVSPAQMEMSAKMVVNIFGGSEPVREPDLKPVQNLLASSSRVLIELMPDLPPGSDLMDPMNPLNPLMPGQRPVPVEDENLPDEFRKAKNNAGMMDGMAGMGGGMGNLAYAPAMMEESTAPRGRSKSSKSSKKGSGADLAMMEPGMMDPMMAGGPAMELKGQGYHFVSVRGIFPLRDQIMKYAEAIHKPFHVAAAEFDILDFELERQMAQPGPTPWSGSWEKVDLQAASDILDKSAGFDAEVVNSMVTNAVITMPLPVRISGEWRKQATHPQIEKFELTDAQISMEAEMQRKLLNEAVSQKKEMDSAVNRRKGFASFVLDARQMNADILGGNMYSMGGPEMGMGMGGAMGGGPGMGMSGGPMGMGGGMGGAMGGGRTTRQPNQEMPIDKLISDMAKGATNKAEEEKRIREWIQSRVSAEGELLLFRYVDFNVEPGKFYRYRVRLVLKNPNYGKRISDAGGVPHVVEGETRLTPWSEITKPTYVEEDVKYFATDVKDPGGIRVLPEARFDVFEWNPSFGTFINAAFNVRVGQAVAEEIETNVIDPAKGLNEPQKYHFTSTDYLVDAIPEIRLEDALHEKSDDGKTVKLPPGLRGKLPIASQALMADRNGSLAYLSPEYRRQEYTMQKSYMDMQNKQFEYLKAPKQDENMSALMELGLASGEPGMEGGSGSRQRSALKRSDRRKPTRAGGMAPP